MYIPEKLMDPICTFVQSCVRSLLIAGLVKRNEKGYGFVLCQ